MLDRLHLYKVLFTTESTLHYKSHPPIHTNIHTALLHTSLRHNVIIQCLAKGDTWTGGAGDQTTNLLISGQPMEFFPVSIQQCGLSFREQDLLISHSVFVMLPLRQNPALALKYSPLVLKLCVSKTLWVRKLTLLLHLVFYWLGNLNRLVAEKYSLVHRSSMSAGRPKAGWQESIQATKYVSATSRANLSISRSYLSARAGFWVKHCKIWTWKRTRSRMKRGKYPLYILYVSNSLTKK